MQRALKFAQLQEMLQVVKDGQEALDYLAGNGPTPNRELYLVQPLSCLTSSSRNGRVLRY
jgi:hypothetical protein